MQIMLSDEEAQVLADTVKGRLDQLGASIAKADTRDFRDKVVAEGDVLEGIYAKLGCSHPEWTESRACDIQPPKAVVDESTGYGVGAK